jgi:hypothetical protein
MRYTDGDMYVAAKLTCVGLNMGGYCPWSHVVKVSDILTQNSFEIAFA